MLFFLIAIGLLGFVMLPPSPNSPKSKTPAATKKQIGRGAYLVHGGGCNDCHSPKIFTPMGPIPDTTKLLSGSPSDEKLPEIPKGLIGPQGWGAVTSNDLTVWVGPWGTSFTRNLTPDVATGLGSWTEDIFIKAIRTGKDMGEGRDILPPMPWPEYRNLTDDDLKAIFAYLKSLPPIENAVPDPISPTGERVPTKKVENK
jgi:mono/diheme cytochrome c family protein